MAAGSDRTVLALDIGGTKLAAAVVGLDGALSDIQRVPTGADATASLSALLDRFPHAYDGVGVGCGGPMRWPDGVVSPLNITSWREFPLREWLSQRYPGAAVRLHNDAVCLAVAEHWRGRWGTEDLLGMVVSTGVGGGLVLGGHLVDGATGNAGHVGHVVVDLAPDAPVCGCGGRGCLEAVARGPALVAWAALRGCPATDGVALASLAATGDAVAVAAFDRAGRALGLGIASAVALLDVRVVVVGGGLSQVGELLWGPLREELSVRARLGFLAGLVVAPARLGQESGLLGAAALHLAGDRYWTDEAPRVEPDGIGLGRR